MINKELIDIAISASKNWGGTKSEPKLIKTRENIVLDITLNSGQRAALRLHRPGYQSFDAINSELLWMETLADMRFPCPSPIRAISGELAIEIPNFRTISLIEWIEATEVGESVSQLKETTLINLFTTIGHHIAQLHNLTDKIDTKSFTRTNWDSQAFFSEKPLWGKYWKNPSLSKDEATQIYEARQKLSDEINTIHNSDIGLIHADLLKENILENTSGLWFIDFDDSGFGFREYDLATALIQHIDNPYFESIKKALVNGYNNHRQYFKTNSNSLNFFIILRSLASCGWVIGRVPDADPNQRVQALRALKCLKIFSDFK